MSTTIKTYQATKMGSIVAQLCIYAYICTNRTHSASRKISKWVLTKDNNFIKDNTPLRLTSVAHLRGLLFLGL